MEYTEVKFADVDENVKDILIAMLAEYQYEGFEETETTLTAFIPSKSFDPIKLEEIARQLQAGYSVSQVPSQNWNSTWESNFDPVTVDDFCTIRAHFHPPADNARHEIIITPKMSFGTGHHATTFMMISQMSTCSFNKKSVFDFGTGTGVLAILAAKLGAKEILAIDNDEWSIANATENAMLNNAGSIEIQLADNARLDRSFDIILANITKNIIVANFADMIACLKETGILLLSGLLEDDEQDIADLASHHNLEPLDRMKRAQWICLKYKKRKQK